MTQRGPSTALMVGVMVFSALVGGGGMVLQASTTNVSNSGPSGTTQAGSQNKGSGNTGEEQCILFVNSCPVENPLCGKEPLQIAVRCSDPSCVPTSCVPASAVTPPAPAQPTTTSGNSGNSGSSNSCMLRSFGCAKESSLSCFKRWRSRSIDCRDAACNTGGCMGSSVFFASYILEPWDTGSLPGPFPRTETLCVVQRSACPANDPACLSPVSLEQVACDDVSCTSNTCMRSSVLVDQHDMMISSTPSGTSGPSVSQQESGTVSEEPLKSTTVLGCFDQSGQWTTDRTLCAPDQFIFVQPVTSPTTQPSVVPGQTAVERTIEAAFIPDAKRAALMQNVLALITEASGRLSRLLENTALPLPLRDQISETIVWMKAAQGTASASDVPLHSLQNLADETAIRLAAVQESITQWTPVPADPTPVTVLSSLDRLFTAMPSVFDLLLQEQVAITPATIESYLTAQQQYALTRTSCVNENNTCWQLSQVIDALEPVLLGLQQSLSLAGRTDLEAQIDFLLMSQQ